MDPVEFRLKNLTDERMIRVLKAAAEKFGWTPAKAPSGRGYGVACGIDAGTYVAAIAEVAVDTRTGTCSVKRVVCAQDMGIVVNPEGAQIQMEGCITMGLGYALTEEIHFQGGKVLAPQLRHLRDPALLLGAEDRDGAVEAKDSPPRAAASRPSSSWAPWSPTRSSTTGARLLQLPMTPDRIKAALQKV